jgi:hypothetical protein
VNRRSFTPGRGLTIGEQLRLERDKRTFAQQLGKLIGSFILMAILWL